MNRKRPSIEPAPQPSTPIALPILLVALTLSVQIGCRRQQPAATPTPPTADADRPQQSASPETTQPATPDAATPDASKTQANATAHPVETQDLPQGDTSGSWTLRRFVVMSAQGPLVFDLAANIDGHDLQQASDWSLRQISDEIIKELEAPARWEALLGLPLVRSGWLGNLVANEDQTGQLIGLYDTDGDGIANHTELAAFLSRGLSRVQPLQVTDIGGEPDADRNESPWGPADANNDFALAADELQALTSVVARLDRNNDGLITSAEASPRQTANMSGSNSRSMLQMNSLLQFDEASLADDAEVNKMRRKLAGDVLRQYSFLGQLSRDQWPACSDSLWTQLDSNGDDQLTRDELTQLFDVAPQATLYVRFPNPDRAQQHPSYFVATPDTQATVAQSDSASASKAAPARQPSTARMAAAVTTDPPASVVSETRPGQPLPAVQWQASHIGDTQVGGKLKSQPCWALVQVRDDFTSVGQMQLRTQLQLALKNPQLKAFFVSQLQLQEDAFSLLDTDANEKLDDDEFARVWRWLTARQGTRLLARWMVAGIPWFRLGDSDGDERLSELEVQGLPTQLARFDRNADGRLTPNEIPLVAKLEIDRRDSRLSSTPMGTSPTIPVADSDWFTAMDTNRDSYISTAEFLGGPDDFQVLDQNADGFLQAIEVYQAQ